MFFRFIDHVEQIKQAVFLTLINLIFNRIELIATLWGNISDNC